MADLTPANILTNANTWINNQTTGQFEGFVPDVATQAFLAAIPGTTAESVFNLFETLTSAALRNNAQVPDPLLLQTYGPLGISYSLNDNEFTYTAAMRFKSDKMLGIIYSLSDDLLNLLAVSFIVTTNTTLEITFNATLDNSVVPANTDFIVSGGRTVTNVAINNRVVVLTINNPIAIGESVTITYTPGTNILISSDGLTSNSFTNIASNSLSSLVVTPTEITVTNPITLQAPATIATITWFIDIIATNQTIEIAGVPNALPTTINDPRGILTTAHLSGITGALTIGTDTARGNLVGSGDLDVFVQVTDTDDINTIQKV